LSGSEAEEILRHELKIQCELSDAENLLFLITFADSDETIAALIAALKKLPTRPKKFLPPPIVNRNITIAALSPRETFYAPTEVVPLKNSVERICAEEVTFYPPGIPLIMPGEKISAQAVEMIQRSSGKVFGATDQTLSTLKVVR